MVQISVKLKIKESTQSLVKRLKEQVIVRKMNFVFAKASPNIENRFKILVGNAIRDTNAYLSLIGALGTSVPGTLKEHFGLPDAQNRIDEVIEEWVNNIKVEHTGFTSQAARTIGGIRFGVIRKDLSEVVNLNVSTLITEKGVSLNWLRWLMERGDDAIITDYHISFASGRGRAGDFIMRKRGQWSVPKEFRGFTGNNFVTKALRPLEKNITNIVKTEIRKIL